jgi:hypothetical protein
MSFDRSMTERSKTLSWLFRGQICAECCPAER